MGTRRSLGRTEQRPIPVPPRITQNNVPRPVSSWRGGSPTCNPMSSGSQRILNLKDLTRSGVETHESFFWVPWPSRVVDPRETLHQHRVVGPLRLTSKYRLWYLPLFFRFQSQTPQVPSIRDLWSHTVTRTQDWGSIPFRTVELISRE